ncbi:hypothetical protein BpHYR1_026569 [Brachionus plicatilis]|uniref:Uncharacterized protein n=1 Tax=Brachionus plicatilis TaxID=10195 RepID=A0A3M7PE98_BRAPC|nr:hypothetical protein BpHYR1_026569 [Brachionus plicatilis]
MYSTDLFLWFYQNLRELTKILSHFDTLVLLVDLTSRHFSQLQFQLPNLSNQKLKFKFQPFSDLFGASSFFFTFFYYFSLKSIKIYENFHVEDLSRQFEGFRRIYTLILKNIRNFKLLIQIN